MYKLNMVTLSEQLVVIPELICTDQVPYICSNGILLRLVLQVKLTGLLHDQFYLNLNANDAIDGLMTWYPNLSRTQNYIDLSISLFYLG